jgi:regulator of nonsense transcripts 2
MFRRAFTISTDKHQVVHIVHKIFTKPQNIKYGNIHFLAIILGSINRYHPEFAIAAIDDVLENITLGLEMSDFKFNQRRLAEVRYLGELYVYRMVDSSIIFDTLFKIITFGYGGYPRPGVVNPIDPPDDFFRLRLVCSILETCGMYYDKGAAKKKLDFFLTFFQYYIQLKETMPMDIDFVVQDAYGAIRPQWKLATTLEEAGTKFAESCKDNYGTTSADKALEAQEADEAEGLDEEANDDINGRQSPNEDDASSDDEAEVCCLLSSNEEYFIDRS